METTQARQLAEERGADLVEVSPEADPPVCRMMDYGKYKYKQKKKQQQGQKKTRQAQIKELRVRPKTDTHDISVKMKKAREFLAMGDRVIINMLFRGREMALKPRGDELLRKLAAELEDVAKMEREPTSQGRRMHIVLAPKHHT